MSKPENSSGSWEATLRRNTVRLAAWTGAWVLSMAIATFGPKFAWGGNESLTLIAILVNLAIGIGMIVANKNHLRALDELHQKVQLEAMGLALGVGLVFGLGYSLFDVTNLVPFDAEISHLVILTGLTYAIATFLGLRRYQ